jgi:hypothetical protein
MRRRQLFVAAGAALVSACAPRAQEQRWGDGPVALYARPDRGEWPAEFQQQDAEVQAMYRYAVQNREVLRWMPCFCGCVDGGHASNYDCYVREALPDGRVRLDTMSFG